MGSPITFSGFNKIDWNAILDAVMAQERQPFTRLETQKTTLQTQNTQFSTLAGNLTITPTTGAPVVISAGASITLQGLVDAINAQTTSPVSASAVQTAPGSY